MIKSQRSEPEVLAAVDLGSNSFHMIVARLSGGQLTVIDRLREMVRLAAGLSNGNHLDPESQRFEARLIRADAPDAAGFRRFHGRFVLAPPHVLTGVTLQRDDGPY